MRKYSIVGTYPEHGSKNIGDHLITECLLQAVRDNCSDVSFETVWRAESWSVAREKLAGSDHVFFACLAMRPEMHEKEYPWLSRFVERGVPFSIISAGTSLPVHGGKNFFSGFSDGSIRLLKAVNELSSVFTTRGYLTQSFCEFHGLDRAEFSGDIAFYDKRLDAARFESNKPIRKIVVSSPHRFQAYMAQMKVLIDGLRVMFPDALIYVAQHGLCDEVENLCAQMNVSLVKIYEDRSMGLTIYDDADLHVGYRVHGHVSMLKRRRYSYLLEQDGRGCDYGLTLDKKISIPSYFLGGGSGLMGYVGKLAFGRTPVDKGVSVSSAYQMLALVANDARRGFDRFVGLEGQILGFNHRTEAAIKKVL